MENYTPVTIRSFVLKARPLSFILYRFSVIKKERTLAMSVAVGGSLGPIHTVLLHMAAIEAVQHRSQVELPILTWRSL